ncbi:uncharacterized protein Z518_07232 [Rhinocladiella mackenziei CBS 650.93]|uniref:Uncharacterized protein n=1 Tax=Rhinocladiella mackenziei CBS 650.93 TaxID=1442369 RepID=A0A0D2ICU6_9EURO|nr:uncharacterized protein Z518_07232 [Rhinocladiella mackenziei CBS 650.93]KIX03679.1 hypothetical protein Z518_07232 [Rhinocladiella mackenziei CBS 650.93]
MAAFISYQPPENTPSFGHDTITISASADPRDSVPSWPDGQYAEWTWPGCSVEFVDLTGPSRHGEIHEPSPALEILELARRDIIWHGAQGASNASDNVSDANELLTVLEIFSKAEEQFRAKKQLPHSRPARLRVILAYSP